MLLLCDSMLARLARWLRAAGHDTAIAEPTISDTELMEICRIEGRILLSCDRALIERGKAALPTLLLQSNDLDAQARLVKDSLKLDWTAAPFTRCMIDNALVRSATDDERQRVPERSRALPGPFTLCPICERLFWPGSHVQRMVRRLEAWNRYMQ